MEFNVVCAYKNILLPVFLFAFFFTSAHFHPAGSQHFSFSNRHVILVKKFAPFAFFSISRSSSFSVIHDSKDIIII